MKLTENFTLEELTKTSTGIDNIPNDEQIENLKELADNVLQPLRKMYGHAITVNSGFRSFEVNKKVGGSKTSSHRKGEAADIDCSDNAGIFKLLRNHFDFDQLIWERGNDDSPDWVHVSYRRKNNRRQILRMINGSYYNF